MPGDRAALRATFDTAADRYERARPAYPDELFDELVRLTGVAAGDRVLEVGCAGGKATRPLAARGLRVTCVELGAALAARARRELAAFGDVAVVHASFEDWEPPPGLRFRLLVAATSWHWVDPAVRYAKAWRLLAPGGHLAFWSAAHVFPDGGDPFFRELQEVYDDIGEGMPPDAGRPRPGELPDERAAIEATGLFCEVSLRQFAWEVTYDADRYIDLLETFSGHLAMAPWQRDRLYGEVRRRLRDRPDGLLRRGWGAVLHIARRIDAPIPPDAPSMGQGEVLDGRDVFEREEPLP
jgi:SAM-dependent methyltransferase